ncbi:MAG: helix-turn-helix transcriptional regulator [Pseudomonadota bacterium]
MSEKRQTPFLDRKDSSRTAPLVTLSWDYPSGYSIPEHFHQEGQVVFGLRGVMTIRTAQGIWVVPLLRAVWIPPRQVHSITMTGAVPMRTLYLAPQLTRGIDTKCFVMNVSPLLRELLVHSCTQPKWKLGVPRERHFIEFVLDQVRNATAIPLQLVQPADRRAMNIASELVKNPRNARTLEQLSRRSGASKRTLERIFIDETGMTFGKWRQQLRLLHGMRLLASGDKVSSAALEAGYRSPSAFIAAFRKSLGQTPNRYFSSAH